MTVRPATFSWATISLAACLTLQSADAIGRSQTDATVEPVDDVALSQWSDDYEREGDEFLRRGDWKECGRSRLAAADTFARHPRHAQRLAAAARCFQKAHLIGQALSARKSLISAHPRDPLVRDALFDVAAGYHQLAYYSKAMECYDAFAVAFPSDKRASAARANVKELQKALDGEAGDCIEGVDIGTIGERRPGDRRHGTTVR